MNLLLFTLLICTTVPDKMSDDQLRHALGETTQMFNQLKREAAERNIKLELGISKITTEGEMPALWVEETKILTSEQESK